MIVRSLLLAFAMGMFSQSLHAESCNTKTELALLVKAKSEKCSQAIQTLSGRTSIDLANLPGDTLKPLASLTKLQDLKFAATGSFDLVDISSLTKLKSLWIYGGSTSSELIASELNFPKLTSLTVYSEGVTSLGSLSSVPKLKDLSIASSSLQSIAGIEDAIKLERLTIKTDVNIDLDPIGSLEKLKELTIFGDNISDWSFLKNLPKLTSLSIYSKNFRDASFLKDIGRLKSIYLYNSAVANLGDLPGALDTVSLGYASYAADELAHLASRDLDHLSLLSIETSSVKFVERMTSLSYLEISGGALTETLNLESLKNLKEINFNRSRLTVEGIGQMKMLKTVSANYSASIELAQVNSSVESLSIAGYSATDISQISRFGFLSFLNVNHSILGTSSNSLSELTQLQILLAAQAGMNNLAWLKNEKLTHEKLRYLDISGNPVDSYIFQSLEMLPELDYLNLTDTNVNNLDLFDRVRNPFLFTIDWHKEVPVSAEIPNRRSLDALEILANERIEAIEDALEVLARLRQAKQAGSGSSQILNSISSSLAEKAAMTIQRKLAKILATQYLVVKDNEVLQLTFDELTSESLSIQRGEIGYDSFAFHKELGKYDLADASLEEISDLFIEERGGQYKFKDAIVNKNTEDEESQIALKIWRKLKRVVDSSETLLESYIFVTSLMSEGSDLNSSDATNKARESLELAVSDAEKFYAKIQDLSEPLEFEAYGRLRRIVDTIEEGIREGVENDQR